MNVHAARPDGEKAPLILCIDTAGPACQVAVSVGSSVLASRTRPMLRGHGEALVPMVEEVLREAQRDYADLDRIGVTIGPGSFTGLRVGLSAARGFATTLSIPVVGVGSLEALAWSDLETSGADDMVRCVSVDARNGLVYAQRFGPDGDPMEAASVMSDLVFSALVPDKSRLVGSATPVMAALVRAHGKTITLGRTEEEPTIASVASLAAKAAVGERPTPLYLKEPDAKQPSKSGTLIRMATGQESSAS